MAFDLFDIKEEVDFDVIVLHSTFPDYKLVYWLNQFLKIQFIRWEHDLDLFVQNKLVCFASYQYIDEEGQKELNLLKNNTLNSVMENTKNSLFKNKIKEEKVFLIPELSKFDYILKSYGYKPEKLIEKIKKIPNIQIIKQIEISNIKSISHLIF
ncbi:MAG: IPExxxVDY family protein [Flavobacteriales bacterium]